MPLFRRRPVPDVVRAVPLEPGDRRVAWTLTVDGDALVASENGLQLPGRDRLARHRLEWADVERAVWRRPVLTVTEVAAVAGSGAAHTVTLAEEDGDVPAVVQAKVTSSVAWSSHVRLQPSGGVRVVGRRRPGRDLLEWQLIYDADTDPADPSLRAQAEHVLAGARRTVG